MLREPVSQLARVCRQIHVDLLHLFDHLLSGAVVGAKLASSQIIPLVIAAYNAP